MAVGVDRSTAQRARRAARLDDLACAGHERVDLRPGQTEPRLGAGRRAVGIGVVILDDHFLCDHDHSGFRLVDRDQHKDLSDRVMICGGHRVPVFIFMTEEFDFLSLSGDRSLTRYRALAARQLGPSCPVPGAPIPADELAGTIQDWVDELERVHLICRLSPKLRQKHAD